MQVEAHRLKVEQTETSTWMPRGATGSPQKMPTFIYTASAELPAAIDTVLFPFEGKQAVPKPIRIETSSNGLDTAFKMVQGKVEDFFVLQKAAGPKSLAS